MNKILDLSSPTILLLSFLMIGYHPLVSQDIAKPINVILLGTFHYGYSSDVNTTSFPDLYSDRRQNEIELLTDQIAEIDIDKVFVEREPKYQNRSDSLYKLFTSTGINDTTTARSEIVQIGFRVAKKLQLTKVHCVDYKQALPYNEVMEFEKTLPDSLPIAPYFDRPYPFTDKSMKLKLKGTSLIEYYQLLNSSYQQKRRLYDYLHYAMSYVHEDNYVGPEFSGVWYERNLKIFANILAALEEGDETIFILFGSSHTDLFRHFFESNPNFNVIQMSEVLR